MLVIYYLVLCYFAVYNGLADEAPLIRPSQLLISTVIDTTNSDIVRDAINFLKSVRIFGGTMNEATILVGVTGSYDNCSIDLTLLPALTQLGVEVVFLTQTVTYAKTLNKFKMFDLFDSTKFDYFLWLDADIIVFDDPMTHLHMHKYPGEIECVPDFYSYMRRFGKVNTSAEYWNPSLPTFHLLGEHETAPSGVCNTGLLYFDGLSLSNFREGLHRTLSNHTYLEQHGSDRFVDSLIFTQVVHEYSLAVSVLPYSLNFMALFEIEIQEEVQVDAIVMAHLVSDTELYCIRTSSSPLDAPGCSCVYRNKLMSPKGSLLKQTVEEKILSSHETCMLFADTAAMPTLPANVRHQPDIAVSGHEGSTHSAGGAVGNALSCTLLTPPEGAEWVLLALSPSGLVQLDIAIQCVVPREYRDKHSSIEVSNQVTHGKDAVSYQSTVVAALVGASCAADPCSVVFHYTLVLATPSVSAELALLVTLSPRANSPLRLRSVFRVQYEELLTPGQVHYSVNMLLSAKPVALESQLLLAEYLNARRMSGTGVAVCCDTHKGVATVQRLIEHWQGDHLLVIVERTPPLPTGESGTCEQDTEARRLQLADALRELCNTRMKSDAPNHNFLCFVSVAVDGPMEAAWTRQIASALRPDSAQFVYSDVLLEYAQQAAVLARWAKVLSKGGLLVGSRYVSSHRRGSDWNAKSGSHNPGAVSVHNNESVVVPTSLVFKSCGHDDILAMHARRAVDALSLQLAQSVLATHEERDPHFCDAFVEMRGDSVECSPAWFLFKQRTVW